MPYTNTTLSTSLDTTWNSTLGTSFSSIALITGIDLSAQLEVERVFGSDRDGNALLVTNFMNNANVKLSDKRAVYVIPITRCTLNAATNKITAIDLPASGNVYDYTYYLISDTANTTPLTIKVPAIANGSSITIRRKTVTNQSFVNWTDGNKLTSAQLNLQTKQLLYLAQEMSDTLNTELARSNDITSQIADGAVTPSKISSTIDPWSFYGTIQTVAPTANLHATTRLYTLDKFFQHGVMTKDDVAPTSSAVDILETAATAGNSGLWFNPKNGTINLWAGNAWVTVAGTPVTTANLVSTNTVQTLTAAKTFAAGTVVPFTQTGTGAVARTVDAKLKDTVSVKDFGAVGDGVTDDTVAINAAIAYCGGLLKPTLYFPAGQYNFSEMVPNFGLYINTAMQFIGAGIEKTVLKNTSATGAGLRFASSYTTVSDLTIDQNLSTGIAFRCPGQYSKVENLVIKNQAGSNYACVIDGTTLASLTNVHIFTSTNGFSIGATIPTQYVTLTHCSCEFTLCGLTAGSSSNFIFNNLVFEPVNGTTNYTHIISLTGCLSYQFNNLSCEFYGTSATNECVLVNSCQNISFNGGSWSNTFNNSANAIVFALSGTNRCINFTGIKFTNLSASMTLFSVSDSPYQITWTNIETNCSVLATGINYLNSGNGLSIFNWANINQALPLTLDSNDLLCVNCFNAPISIANRTNLTLINCQGAITGAGATLSTQLNRVVSSSNEFSPKTDNAILLGSGARRWSTVYAGTGAINTSDEREKQQVALLSTAESATAIELRGLIKTFKFNDAVSAKGSNARIHVGVIAQQVQGAFIRNGLDPNKYGMFCYDEWEATETTPSGNRFGIRYDELFAFILSSM